MEQDNEAGCLGTGQYLIVGDSISPLATKDASQVAKVEGIETPLLSEAEATLVRVVGLLFSQTLFVNVSSVEDAFPMCLLISDSSERLFMMLEPSYVNSWATSSS